MPIDKKDPKYGIPQLKKFPLPDARHVRSAIRFFNYVPPRYERQLAAAILRRMKEYGLSFDDFTVGEENRFHKYIPKRQLDQAMAHAICIDNYGRLVASDELYHHGILGQEWGVQNGPPYPLNPVVSARVRMNVKHTEYGQKDPSGDKSRSEHLKNNPIEKLSELARLPEGASIVEARNNINHGTATGEGRSYNCPNCAAAFDMVERGYSVSARPKKDGSNVEDIESFYKGGKLEAVSPKALDPYMSRLKEAYARCEMYRDDERKRKEYKKAYYDCCDIFTEAKSDMRAATVKNLLSQGEGARGVLVVGWHTDINPTKRTMAYHALNYKVENGTPTFYDAQSRKPAKQNGDKDSRFLYGVDPREVYVMRTDNLKPSDEITRAVYSNRRK